MSHKKVIEVGRIRPTSHNRTSNFSILHINEMYFFNFQKRIIVLHFNIFGTIFHEISQNSCPQQCREESYKSHMKNMFVFHYFLYCNSYICVFPVHILDSVSRPTVLGLRKSELIAMIAHCLHLLIRTQM